MNGHDAQTAREFCSRPIASCHVARVIVGLLSGLALVGCGASSGSPATFKKAAAHPKPPPVCEPAASTVIARDAGVGSGVLTARATTGANAEPECHFHGPRLSVVVNIDSSPQPYQRLERTIDEAGQQFGTVRNFAPPVSVPKLGLDAAWLPDESKLLTTDGRSLLTITVTWRRAKPARQITLTTPGRTALRGHLAALQAIADKAEPATAEERRGARASKRRGARRVDALGPRIA